MDILNHRYYAKHSFQDKPARAETATSIALLFVLISSLFLPSKIFTGIQQYEPTYQPEINCSENQARDQIACAGNCLHTQQLQLSWEINRPSFACAQTVTDTVSEINNISLDNMVIESIKKIPAF